MAATSDNIQHFVQDLREAREYRRMPLEQVARDTRIAIQYLKALEAGEWDRIPGPYLRGYLTSYSDAIGMVRDKVLKRFEELGYHGTAESSEGRPSERPPFSRGEDSPALDPSPQVLVPTLWQVMPSSLKISLLAVLGLVPLVLLWFLFSLGGNDDDPPAEAFETTLEQHLDERQERRQVLEGFAPFELKISLMRPAALQVFSRDSLFFRGNLGSDNSLVLQSRSEVVVETERLQDLRLWRNGEAIALPPDSGRADLHVSRQGVQVILRKL